MKGIHRIVFLLLMLVAQLVYAQSLSLPSIYSNQMVLQRDTTVIVGAALPYAEVTITLGEHTGTATTDEKGNWKAMLYGIKAGGPYQLKIATSAATKVFEDVLIGDVWVASGQSNMQWSPSRGIAGWEQEKQNATYDRIRLFHVSRKTDGTPKTDLPDHKWTQCNPKNLEEFSSVAYFFSKYIHESQSIPIGIINSSYGGSTIEAWMSKRSLNMSGAKYDSIPGPETFNKLNKQRSIKVAHRDEILDKVNVGERLGVHLPDYDDSDWKTITTPKNWKDTDLKDAGFVWFRKKVNIENLQEHDGSYVLSLGKIRHKATIYFNGEKLIEGGVNQEYVLDIKRELLAETENTIAIRVLKVWGTSGGFIGEAGDLKLYADDNHQERICLAGDWKYNRGLEPCFPEPHIFHQTPTLLYNAMIAPLTALKVKGFLWYQGESNASRNANRYDDLLKAMITDWRNKFDAPNAPYIVVQLPNFQAHQDQPTDDHWARIRESQANAAELPNVHIVPIIDLGNPKDIHPRNKKDVGKRLAMMARNKIYREDIHYKGPTVQNIEFKGKKAIVTFENVANGLFIKDGKPIREFALAGEDGKFHWAKATIIGKNKIELKSENVKKPIAVRYAWQSNPKVNLYNAANLPAAPFRTDTWELKQAENE